MQAETDPASAHRLLFDAFADAEPSLGKLAKRTPNRLSLQGKILPTIRSRGWPSPCNQSGMLNEYGKDGANMRPCYINSRLSGRHPIQIGPASDHPLESKGESRGRALFIRPVRRAGALLYNSRMRRPLSSTAPSLPEPIPPRIPRTYPFVGVVGPTFVRRGREDQDHCIEAASRRQQPPHWRTRPPRPGSRSASGANHPRWCSPQPNIGSICCSWRFPRHGTNT